MTIVYDEEEKSTARAGDNVKLKLKGVEEDVSPSVVCINCSVDCIASNYDCYV